MCHNIFSWILSTSCRVLCFLCPSSFSANFWRNIHAAYLSLIYSLFPCSADCCRFRWAKFPPAAEVLRLIKAIPFVSTSTHIPHSSHPREFFLWPGKFGRIRYRVVAESCSENLTIGSHFRELPSLTIEYWLPDSECSSNSQDIDSETYANYFFVLIGLLWNSQQDSELKERGSKKLNIKWSLYMSWNHPNLTHCKKWLQGSQNLTHYRTRPLPWCVDFCVRKCVKTADILFHSPRKFPLPVCVTFTREFHTGLPNKACTWFGEVCSCSLSKGRNKVHQTTYKPYSGALYCYS